MRFLKVLQDILVATVLSLFCWGILSYAINPAAPTRQSRVNSYQGIAIFIEAMPVDPWDQLGVVEMETDSAAALMAYNQVLKMLQRTKQLYPSADGFIFSSLNFHSGTAIKFK